MINALMLQACLSVQGMPVQAQQVLRCFLLDLWVLLKTTGNASGFAQEGLAVQNFFSVSGVREHSTSLSSFPLFQGLVKAKQDKAFGSPESPGLAQPLWFWCCPQLSVGAPEPQLFFL